MGEVLAASIRDSSMIAATSTSPKKTCEGRIAKQTRDENRGRGLRIPWLTMPSSSRKPQEDAARPPRRRRRARAPAAPHPAGRAAADRARGGLYFYLAGGRYISTDNAYVGAQKMLITPDISGKIAQVTVREGERVERRRRAVRDRSRAVPHRVMQAEARLASVRTDFANLKSNLASIDAAHRAGARDRRPQAARRRPQEHAAHQPHRFAGRPRQCAQRRGGAKTQLEQLEQQRDAIRNQLLGDPDLPIEKYPPYMQAAAALDQASAISTTPCCARRSPAWRRRSPASSSAATSRPARRCSA